MNKFLNQEYYKQLEKINTIINFTKSIKDNFISEELYNIQLNSLQEEAKSIREKIKQNS